MGKTVTRIEGIVEPVAEALRLELVDVEFVKEGENWVLRIFIENPRGETTLDDCEAVSRKLSTLLDEQDSIEQSYILEVSSPGLERPLKKKADYERFKDHLVAITTYAPVEGSKEFKGRLIKREGEKVYLDIDGDVIEIPSAIIASANLAVDF